MTERTEEVLRADYLVVGAGAMGMAFVDTMVAESDATLIVVDRHHQPGGHWNTAYPFVRLHQPSAFYGVNSAPLGRDRVDTVGHNAGLHELATAGEVTGYFAQVMEQHMLASGRVRYFPRCDYLGDGRFRSLLGGQTYRVEATTVVDATYMRVTVPSMRSPPFTVAEGVTCVTPNELVRTTAPAARYVVVGAGKTGIDACLWLLRNRVAPEAIGWVMPRDAWLLDRAQYQPGEAFVPAFLRGRDRQGRAVLTADDADELLEELGRDGQLLRLDESVRATMYRCATVTRSELAELRRIEDVIRLGRVTGIAADMITFEHGVRPAEASTIYVDCTADGLAKRPSVPVFADGTIVLQPVRVCQQVFSAALIAHVEASGRDAAAKNDLCVPVPHPDTAHDWLRVTAQSMRNQLRWMMEPGLPEWLAASRLDWFGRLLPRLPDDPAQRATLGAAAARQAMAQIAKLTVLYEKATIGAAADA